MIHSIIHYDGLDQAKAAETIAMATAASRYFRLEASLNGLEAMNNRNSRTDRQTETLTTPRRRFFHGGSKPGACGVRTNLLRIEIRGDRNRIVQNFPKFTHLFISNVVCIHGSCLYARFSNVNFLLSRLITDMRTADQIHAFLERKTAERRFRNCKDLSVC